MQGVIAATALLGTATATVTATASATGKTGVRFAQDADGVLYVPRTEIFAEESDAPVIPNSDVEPFFWLIDPVTSAAEETGVRVQQDASGALYASRSAPAAAVRSGVPIGQDEDGVPFIWQPAASTSTAAKETGVHVEQDKNGIPYVSRTKVFGNASGIPVAQDSDGVPFLWKPATSTSATANATGVRVQQDRNGIPYVSRTKVFSNSSGIPVAQNSAGVPFIWQPATSTSAATKETGVRVQQDVNGIPYISRTKIFGNATGIPVAQDSNGVPFIWLPATTSSPAASVAQGPIIVSVFTTTEPAVSVAQGPIIVPAFTTTATVSTLLSARDSWPTPIEFCKDHGTVCGPTPLPEPKICIGCPRAVTALVGDESAAEPTTFVTVTAVHGVVHDETAAVAAEPITTGRRRLCGERHMC